MNRWGTRLHAWIYRRSGGRILGSIGGQPVLVLQTTGRRSGRTRITPVQYLARGKGYAIVAADHGAHLAPAWYLNLAANPQGRVRVGKHSFDVGAHETRGAERAELWRELVGTNRYLPKVQTKARRQLPVLLLTPTTDRHED